MIPTFSEMGTCLSLLPPYPDERSLEGRNEVSVQLFLAEGQHACSWAALPV